MMTTTVSVSGRQFPPVDVNTKCTCGVDNSLELSRKNFNFHAVDEKLEKYFSDAYEPNI